MDHSESCSVTQGILCNEEAIQNKMREFQVEFPYFRQEIIHFLHKIEPFTWESEKLHPSPRKGVQLSVTAPDDEATLCRGNLKKLHSLVMNFARKFDRENDDVIQEEEADDEYDEEGEDEERKKKHFRKRASKKYKSEVPSDYSSQEQNKTQECETRFEGENLLVQIAKNSSRSEPSTSCDIDDRAVEAGLCIPDLDESGYRRETSANNSSLCEDNTMDDPVCQDCSSTGAEEGGKSEKEDKTKLSQALTAAEINITRQKAIIFALSCERELLKNKLEDYQSMQRAIPTVAHHISDAVKVQGLRRSPVPGNNVEGGGTKSVIVSHVASHDEIISKLAEKVRLKKVEKGDQRITGSDLSAGVYTTSVAELLVARLQEESDSQEVFNALATAGGSFTSHELLKDCELEAERLHARIDHLKAQNDVLSATLVESKTHCDRLALMTSKAEARSCALKLGVEALLRVQEASEILVSLQEAQIAFLLACPLSQGEGDSLIKLEKAKEARKASEDSCRSFVAKLDEVKLRGLVNGDSSTEENEMFSLEELTEATYESHIRNIIRSLQEEQRKILTCLEEGPEEGSQDYFPQSLPIPNDEALKLDLENALLVQELTAIKEERAELRAQLYLLEREKAGVELRIGTCEAQTAAYSIVVEHLQEELKAKNLIYEDIHYENQVLPEDGSSVVLEKQLKTRIEELISALEIATKNFEARYLQSQEFINDLKKANSAILTAFDRMKKKYSLRIRRLEQQIQNMSQKQATEVNVVRVKMETLKEVQIHRPKIQLVSSR